jgi:hypothetical protein
MLFGKPEGESERYPISRNVRPRGLVLCSSVISLI